MRKKSTDPATPVVSVFLMAALWNNRKVVMETTGPHTLKHLLSVSLQSKFQTPVGNVLEGALGAAVNALPFCPLVVRQLQWCASQLLGLLSWMSPLRY